MATEDLNLSGIRNLEQALSRTPNGTDAVTLAKRLGLWSTAAHADVAERPKFQPNLSTLEHPQLSDQYGLWTAEFGRITELIGALIGQREQLRVQGKSTRAEARGRVRRKYDQAPEKKSPTATVVSDEAEEDPAVLELEEKLSLVEVLLAHAQAAKEATITYLNTLSREISFRDAQLKGRIYG